MNELLVKIDALIESQQRLVEALERQADAIAELIDSQQVSDDMQGVHSLRLLDER